MTVSQRRKTGVAGCASQTESANSGMEFHLYKIEAGSKTNPGRGHTITYIITLEWKDGLIPFGEFCRQINDAIKQQSGQTELTTNDIIFSLRSHLLR